MTLDCEVVITRSGATAMRDRTTGEVMHPVVGPLYEAARLYLAGSRLAARLRRSWGVATAGPLVLFDVGLGAGSNAIAAWRLSESMAAGDRRLQIVSFERSLAALQLALEPRHCAAFGLDGSAGAAARMLLAEGRHETARTSWRLRAGDLESTLALEAAGSADVVFWDPFSPRADPAPWSVGVFSTLRRSCREGVTLHTYSGATAVRSALLLAGFAVGFGTGEGDGAGRGGYGAGRGGYGTCAALRAQDLAAPLDRRWLERLFRSSAPLPADAPPDALELIACLPQFRARCA